MSKKERIVVAVIVIAALVAGLFVVGRSIEKAKAAQSAVMERATSNLGELPQQTPEGEADAEEKEGEAVSGDHAPVVSHEEETPQQAVEPLQPSDSPLLAALERGDFSDLETLKALGLLDEASRPVLGTAELNPQILSEWMGTQSAEALAAQAAPPAAPGGDVPAVSAEVAPEI